MRKTSENQVTAALTLKVPQTVGWWRVDRPSGVFKSTAAPI